MINFPHFAGCTDLIYKDSLCPHIVNVSFGIYMKFKKLR